MTRLLTDQKIGTKHSPTRHVSVQASISEQFSEVFDIPYGLTIVGMDKPELTPFVRNTFTHMVRHGINRFGIGMPRPSKVISACTGERHAHHLAFLTTANKTSDDAAPHMIKDLGLSKSIHWTSPEGVLILKPLITTGESWVMLEQAGPSTLNTASSIEAKILISKMAKEAKVRIMLFVVASESGDKYRLDQCFGEYIAVNDCEPDFGCDSAFSIDVASLRDLNGIGIGKTMCCVKFENGIFRRRCTPFISEQLENRVIWALRAQGKTLDEIAKIVKINKSTALRRLQTMPPVRQIKGNDALISHYLNAPPIIGDTSSPHQGDLVTGNKATG